MTVVRGSETGHLVILPHHAVPGLKQPCVPRGAGWRGAGAGPFEGGAARDPTEALLPEAHQAYRRGDFSQALQLCHAVRAASGTAINAIDFEQQTKQITLLISKYRRCKYPDLFRKTDTADNVIDFEQQTVLESCGPAAPLCCQLCLAVRAAAAGVNSN